MKNTIIFAFVGSLPLWLVLLGFLTGGIKCIAQ